MRRGRNLWVIEENDRSDGLNADWFPLDGWAYLKKPDAEEAASNIRGYLRRERRKECRVRVREYVRKESK